VAAVTPVAGTAKAPCLVAQQPTKTAATWSCVVDPRLRQNNSAPVVTAVTAVGVVVTAVTPAGVVVTAVADVTPRAMTARVLVNVTLASVNAWLVVVNVLEQLGKVYLEYDITNDLLINKHVMIDVVFYRRGGA